MLENSPFTRKIIYWAAIIVNVAAIFFTESFPDWTWVVGLEKTGNYLAALAGMTALGNIFVKPKDSLDGPLK